MDGKESPASQQMHWAVSDFIFAFFLFIHSTLDLWEKIANFTSRIIIVKVYAITKVKSFLFEVTPGKNRVLMQLRGGKLHTKLKEKLVL